MKIITISKIGYNAPSQANWTYSIFKIDLIDTDKNYCDSIITKSAFGSDSNFRKQWEKIQIIQTKDVYTGTGTQKITGISKIPDIESKEVETQIVHFIN